MGAIEEASKYGLRPDGTPKGKGWLGELKRPDGQVSTELSVQFDDVLGGKPIPLLVPTLQPKEVEYLLKGNRATPEIIQKAVDHANGRAKLGLSPFAE